MATKLKKLVLNEVSLVDRGANQHAHVTLFKRDAGDDSLQGKIGEATAALAKSIETIIADTEADKPAAFAETFKQYQDHIKVVAKDMYDVSRFADLLSSIGYLAQSSQYEAAAEGDNSKVPAKMRGWLEQGSQIFQQMATEEVNELLAAANAVSKRNGGDAGETLTQKEQEMTDIAKKLADAEVALAKANKELAFAKMSDAHKAYATETKLEGEALEAFVAKSAAERDDHIKAAPVVKAVDAEVAKRDAEIAELRKRVDAADEAKVVAEFAKKATDLGLPEAKGDMLRKAYSGDKTAQAEVETLIKGLREQIKTGKLFDEFGTKQPGDATSPKARVMAKVAELRKADATLDTDQKAIAKIAADPALRDLWNEYKAAPAAA